MRDANRDQIRPISEDLYRLLLRAYPHAFREEYAAEMLLVFRDAYAEAAARRGRLGVLRLWGHILGDYATSLWTQRLRSWLAADKKRGLLAGKEDFAMALQFTLDVAQRTDIGLKRASNEDNLISVVPDDQHLLATRGALFVVSDGMGGHRHGDVASELVIQTVTDYYYHYWQQDIPTTLKAALHQANASIYQANIAAKSSDSSEQVMGATGVAAVLHEHMLYVANVGDSRVYVLHAGQLRQITRDHSLVAQMVERGELSAAAARTHESRNIIYRSLGLVEVEVDLFTEPVAAGDAIILCTDGLCSVVPDDEMQAIVAQNEPAASVQHLIARANEAGGPDNVTAIVVRVSGS